MGVHWPWLRPEEHAEGPRRASRYREDDGSHSGIYGATTARMAWAWLDRDMGYARYPGRRRLRIRLRLGSGRPTGCAEHARPFTRERAVHARMQRRRDDANSASPSGGIQGPCDRSVRADVFRRTRLRADHGAG